jgi:hypothetical protein
VEAKDVEARLEFVAEVKLIEFVVEFGYGVGNVEADVAFAVVEVEEFVRLLRTANGSVSLNPVIVEFDRNGVKTEASTRWNGAPAASTPEQYAYSVPGERRISP